MKLTQVHQSPATERPLAAIIIGSGFGGIGMGIALRKAGIYDFVILERAHDVGGVWRDNSYPGAACDVPSHLYSFSFEPNPNWTRAFARQDEIHTYLRHCARKYGLMPHLRFGAEVASAAYDERDEVWHVTLVNGTRLSAQQLITATGQLSRPSLPKLPGIDAFRGHAFHSARWDHDYDLSGKRVAVVGTGASAIQFVPAIADRVAQLTVFQRSPSHIMPRPDRPYSEREQARFHRSPWTMKLHRAAIYMQYESRAIAFTRFKGLLKLVVGRAFERQLKRQVSDAALRTKLRPDYQIGCKRILLSSDYLATMAHPKVRLDTTGIRRVTEQGIETVDGVQHEVDAIVYGTGFAATEFLAPMQIQGRGGLDLNQAWQGGAQAYLGMTVPGFPNFFMLYGPNTNLGHNSIIYMLESQISHVMRCLHAMRKAGANAIDVDVDRYQRLNAQIQKQLAGSVWSSCKSWYVDANGHNSTNWPGFTLTYRFLTRFSSLRAYRFSRALPSDAGQARGAVVMPPAGRFEAANAAFQRGFLRVAFRTFIGTPFSAPQQRRVIRLLSPLMPAGAGAVRTHRQVGDVPVEIVTPKSHRKSGAAMPDYGLHDEGAMLYLHGGAFCLGSPDTHRSITTRLAVASGMEVMVPDYRLAPEHPYPAALDDALACYAALRERGYEAGQIVIAGDSAGGALALALALTLRDRGEAPAAGLLLIAPGTDPTLSGTSMQSRKKADPMVRRAWLEQGRDWYNAPLASAPLESDLRGLPPMLVQVGDQEILLSDAVRLAERAAAQGAACELEIHAKRWHVFHLQAAYLQSSREALCRLAGFARQCVTARADERHAGKVTRLSDAA